MNGVKRADYFTYTDRCACCLATAGAICFRRSSKPNGRTFPSHWAIYLHRNRDSCDTRLCAKCWAECYRQEKVTFYCIPLACCRSCCATASFHIPQHPLASSHHTMLSSHSEPVVACLADHWQVVATDEDRSRVAMHAAILLLSSVSVLVYSHHL